MKELHKIREKWSKMSEKEREASIRHSAEEARARIREIREKKLRKVS